MSSLGDELSVVDGSSAFERATATRSDAERSCGCERMTMQASVRELVEVIPEVRTHAHCALVTGTKASA